jgi:cellulose synthase/poly-beta-1,6-N-acetylglucosamine synthase-like glycosyltransferase
MKNNRALRPGKTHMVTAFFILLGLLLYIFLFFPLALVLLAAFNRQRRDTSEAPSVAVLIAARNEQPRIAAKIANTLASRYPPDKLTVLIASDGSTDGTDDEVRACRDPRVRLVSLSPGVGKTSAINRLAQDAKAEILIVSDADVLIHADAIRNLARHFSNPRVGAVCGRRSDRSRTANASWPARLYNLYEGALKRGEGRLGRVLGGDGSLYALRRVCFRPLPPDVPDDFISVLRVLEQGGRVFYDKNAVSWEELEVSDLTEFKRKRRTVARGVRGLWTVRGLLNPLRFPLISFLLLSHKILRWCAGFFLLALLLLNAALCRQAFFQWFLAAQLLFYGMAVAGSLAVRHPLSKPLKMVRYFALTNLAAACGIIDVLLRRDWSSWTVQRAS